MVAFAMPGGAVADDDFDDLTVEADADAGASDARVVALDAAFANAVKQSVESLADRTQIAAKRVDYDKEIVGRARLWVASFSVTSDQVIDGRRRLAVKVRIDQRKLGLRMQQLGIIQTLPDGNGDGSMPGAGASVATVEGDSVTLLARALSPTQVRANYGASAGRLPEFDGFKAALAARGYRWRPTPAAGPAATRAGAIPLNDSAALAFAGDAKADSALIVGLDVSAPTAIRGAVGDYVVAHARARWLHRKSGNAIVDLQRTVLRSTVAGAGDDANQAGYQVIGDIVVALQAATAPPRSAAAAPLMARDVPAVVADEGHVAVLVGRAAPVAVVAALLKALAAQSGNGDVALAQLSPAGYVITITTKQSPSKIAGQIRKIMIPERTISADVKGNIVRAMVSAAPSPVLQPGPLGTPAQPAHGVPQ
ncbi:MAG: hypothetical protein KBG15_03930 [Kofleriaceae bacterium]|nr:hypothetical protein [Kofleriaceae bacterium]